MVTFSTTNWLLWYRLVLYTRCLYCFVFSFNQWTAYEMRISNWSSDVCSSDLLDIGEGAAARRRRLRPIERQHRVHRQPARGRLAGRQASRERPEAAPAPGRRLGGEPPLDRLAQHVATGRRHIGRAFHHHRPVAALEDKIGSTSCRESVCPYV